MLIKMTKSKNKVINKRLVSCQHVVSSSLLICLYSSQGHGLWHINRPQRLSELYMERTSLCVWEGVTTQELICLSLLGQQEFGLFCLDGRWPLWRQPGFRLLPGPFENTSALLEWLAIWETVPSTWPPPCQACFVRHGWKAWQPSSILFLFQ